MFNFNQGEESRPKMKLSPGPASISINQIYDTDREGQPLVSKNGNRMIKIELRAVDEHTADGLIYDYVPCIARMKWKAQQVAECFGVPEAFKGGELNAHLLINKQGRCILKIDESPGYSPRIVIEQYIAAASSQGVAKNNVVENEDPFLDEIPF